MKKKDEAADQKSCLNTAGGDDFVFVLKQKDRAMAATIRFWVRERIKLGLNAAGDPKLETALLEAQIVELRQAGSNTEELESRLAGMLAVVRGS
jgi:hypothetical protein